MFKKLLSKFSWSSSSSSSGPLAASSVEMEVLVSNAAVQDGHLFVFGPGFISSRWTGQDSDLHFAAPSWYDLGVYSGSYMEASGVSLQTLFESVSMVHYLVYPDHSRTDSMCLYLSDNSTVNGYIG